MELGRGVLVALLAGWLTAGLVRAAPDPPLGYQDEEKIKRFDYQYTGAKTDLERATDEVARRDNFASSFEQKLGFMRTALNQVSKQDHGEVVRRRRAMEQLEADFTRRRTEVLAQIGDADRTAIANCDRKLAEILAKLLELDGKSTILTGTPSAPGTLFDDDLRKLREQLTRIRNQEHADVVAARQRLSEAEDAVAAAKASCQATLATLGDIEAVAGAHVEWIMKHHHIDSSRNVLLPLPPETITPDAFREYAAQLKTAGAELQERVAYLTRLPVWVPGWGGHALRERASRAVQVSRDALRDPGARVDNPREPMTAAAVDAIDLRTLREAVGSPNRHLHELSEIIQYAESAAAFREAFYGKPDPKLARTLADARARKARLEERIQKQLDSERLPGPGPAHATHAAIARELVPGALALVVAGEVEHYEGTDTSKQEVGRRGVGNGMDEVTYRVHKYPYNYDFLNVYAVFEESGFFQVFYVELKHHHIKYGDEPLGRWFASDRYFQHCIRRENIQAPDVEETRAPATTATAAPLPVSSTPAPSQATISETPAAPTEEPAPAATAEPTARGLGPLLGVLLGGGCCLLVLVGAAVALFMAKAKTAAGSAGSPPTASG